MSNRARNLGRKQGARLRKANGPLEVILAALLIVGVIVACIALVSVFVVLGGLLTLLAWNVGVVGIAAALGSQVATINLGIAICANIAISILARIFNRQPTTVSTTK